MPIRMVIVGLPAAGSITDLGSCNRHLAAPLLAPLKDRMYDISERRTALKE